MKENEILNVIKELAKARAPSGLESERGLIFKREIEKQLINKNISVKNDELGNFYIKLKGTSGKESVAILAHLDEIGGTIRRIKKNGKLEFSKRGGYESRWLISREIKIFNSESKWINGIICGRSTHSTPETLRAKEKIEALELEIYIGATDKKEVADEYKIHVGAPFVFDGDFDLLNLEVNNDVIAGFSMDNLAALTCLIVLTQKIVKNLMTDFGTLKITSDVYIVATTREEIGTEGALYFIRNNPVKKVIAIDIGLVADFTGAISSDIELNKGPVIVWQDSSGKGIYDYNFCKALKEIAEKHNLEYQNGVFESYGSDAGVAQKWLGIPSALIGIPVMFSHNVPEICTLNGIEKGAEFVFHYLKSLK